MNELITLTIGQGLLMVVLGGVLASGGWIVVLGIRLAGQRRRERAVVRFFDERGEAVRCFHKGGETL